MSSKLKLISDRVVNNLIAKNKFKSAGILATLLVTIADKRYTRVKWDGEDWEFKWSAGSLYWDAPLIKVTDMSDRNMGLFLDKYQPKLDDIIFDVGAGAGTEVVHFSRMVGPKGRVYAIEADPAALRRLKKQVSNLTYKNVEILELAVGNAEGIVKLHIAEEGGIENSIKSVVGANYVEVPCKRLDDVIESLKLESISYMKINIEGAEVDALVGLGSKINMVKNFCISCHDFTGDPTQATFDQVKSFLETSNLKISTRPYNPNANWENFYLFAKH
jgi:FkbM family methyltransferase